MECGSRVQTVLQECSLHSIQDFYNKFLFFSSRKLFYFLRLSFRIIPVFRVYPRCIFVTVAVTRVLLNRRLSSASGRRHPPPWGVPRFLILEAKAS